MERYPDWNYLGQIPGKFGRDSRKFLREFWASWGSFRAAAGSGVFGPRISSSSGSGSGSGGSGGKARYSWFLFGLLEAPEAVL